jgi:hypothetical protein
MQDLISEIKITYADNQGDGKTFDQTKHTRRLEWKSNQPVSRNMIVTALIATGEAYNAFESISVAKTIREVDPKAEVFVAREGSVCLYIKTEHPDEMIKALDSADEADMQPDGTIRFWWD